MPRLETEAIRLPSDQEWVTPAMFQTYSLVSIVSSDPLRLSYDYDPYGRSTTVLGTTPTDFNFTGLCRHSKSNLDLAVFRAYDPDLGRWLNRDPIAERGGLNLYDYVHNDPANAIDPSGKSWVSPWWGLWGGPDWANGEHRSETGKLPTPGDSGYRPPQDNRDLCYYYHDQCISHCYNCGFNGI